MVKRKKGQLKIQQMAFMLIAVTLFFVMVGMFVLVIKISGLRESANLLEEEESMLLAAKLANSPEFACGESFGGTAIGCIDADKVMALKKIIKDSTKYNKFWGIQNIEIYRIYPPEETITECKLEDGNYPDCNFIRLREDIEGGLRSSNFISLCRKEFDGTETYDQCDIAKLIVIYKTQ